MTIIRVAKLSDAKRLADLAESSFIDAFSEQNTTEDMDTHCQSSYGEAIQADEISNPESVTIVAENSGNLIAYAQLKWGKYPSCVSASLPGEIQRLYVDKAWHGKGLAQDLMLACLEKMEERNTDIVWLGVWEENPKAISFYKKFNFREVGAHVFPLGREYQRDIIMMRHVKNAVQNA